MAKDPDSVTTFLADLKTKLQPLKEDEMGLFLQYKKEEVLFLIQFNYLFAQYCAIAWHTCKCHNVSINNITNTKNPICKYLKKSKNY